MRKQYLLTSPLRHWLKCLMVTGLFVTSIQSVMAEDICYAVADNDNRPDSADMLVMMSSSGGTMIVGDGTGTGTEHLEAVTFSPDGTILYAADAGQFGTIDYLGTGLFTPIGGGFGSGNGSEGVLLFDDVDGLAFVDGVLYATVRREHGPIPEYDLLIQVEPATGAAIPGAFGGEDYKVVTVIGHPEYYDVDDLATDPSDGTLYAIMNTGDGVESVLVTLDEQTGEATLVGVVNDGSGIIDDIESLSFNTDGSVLYGTTGNGGANNSVAKGTLYQINPATGDAVELGKLLPPTGMDVSLKQQDFEALSCITDGPPPPPQNTCLMYAVHDEGLNDSQMIEINPETDEIRPLGPMYHGLDLEGLALLPEDGKLYATSGYHSGDTKVGLAFGEDGYLYNVERESGLVTPIGPTGYSEVSGLTLDPTTGDMYGWARGRDAKNRYEKDAKGRNDKTKPKVGLIKINHVTGAGTLIVRAKYKKPDIEGIAFSNDGKKVYGTADNDLWVIDMETKTMSLQCPDMFDAEVEAVEMQPNDLLLFGTDGKQELAILAYDPENCDIVASRSFKNTIYDDIESIEWPAHECDGRSWLSPSSGDTVIELLEYGIVNDNTVDALQAALVAANLPGAKIEVHAGLIYVYVLDENGEIIVFTAKVEAASSVRRARSSDAPIDAQFITVDEKLTVVEAGKILFSLNSQIVGPGKYLKTTVENVVGVKKVEVSNEQMVYVTMNDGTKLQAEVSMISTPADVPVGASLLEVEPRVDCAADSCTFTYLDGMTQDFNIVQ